MLDMFVGFFANPINIVMLGIFTGLGLLIGLFLRPWVGNKVLKFIPAEHRFIELGIEEETSISIECQKKKHMPLQRFFKLNPGFTGIVGRFLKKPITTYLALEGTAYTWNLDGGTWHKLGSLADSVRTIWGEDFWGTLPERQNEMLTESRIQVTVGLEKSPLTPEGMRSISEEDIKSEEDRKAAEIFWQERTKAQRGFYINIILAAGTGFAVCAGLVLLGVIQAPGSETVTVVQQAADATAQTVRTLMGR